MNVLSLKTFLGVDKSLNPTHINFFNDKLNRNIRLTLILFNKNISVK